MKLNNLDENLITRGSIYDHFRQGDWPERGVWDRLFQKNWKLHKSKIRKNVNNWLKWVQKNAPGVLKPQGGSKLRCESNGRPPGPQNGNKK